MFFQRIKTPGIAHNAYLIGSNGIGVLIDPRRDVDEYLEIARTNKLEIRYVFETHRQEDFVLGSATIRQQCGAKIVSGKHKYFAHSDLRLADGEDLKVGRLVFRCICTPGHTPESVSYAVYFQDKPDRAWAVFTGDALFVGEAGRTDLPEVDKTAENAAILFDSIQTKIKPLGDQTLLYPAHGAGSVCGGNIADFDESTLGFERRYNPAFTRTREEFIQLKLEERIPRPPHFRLMEKLNLKGGLALSQEPNTIPSLLPMAFKSESTKGIVIDTRLPAAFGGGHIPGSYSIWLDGLPVFGGWIADDKVPVYLVLERPDDLEEACLHLQRIGVDNIRGVLAGGFEGWRDAGLEIVMSGTLSVHSAALQRKRTTILDVREITEFEEGHIRGSRHAYVGFIPELGTIGRQLDRKQPLAVTCSVGHRASLAVSMLLRMGFTNVFNLLGGMTAWKELDKPVVTGPDTPRTLDREILARGMSKEPAARALRTGT